MTEYNIANSVTRRIVKNVVCGNYSAAAKAVFKDVKLKDLVYVEVINEIKHEIRCYSKDSECLLKLTTPGGVRKFSNESFYQQLLLKCPKLAVMMASICKPGNLNRSLPFLTEMETGHKFRNSVCMETSICRHQYNQQLMLPTT